MYLIHFAFILKCVMLTGKFEALFLYYIFHYICAPLHMTSAMKLVSDQRKESLSTLESEDKSNMSSEPNARKIVNHLKHRFGDKYNSAMVISHEEYMSLCRYLFLQRFKVGRNSHSRSAKVLVDSEGFRSYAHDTLQAKRRWTFDQLPLVVNSIWQILMKLPKSEHVLEISRLNQVKMSEDREIDAVNHDSESPPIQNGKDIAHRYSMTGDLGKEFLDKLTLAIEGNIDDLEDVDQRLEGVMISMRNMIYPNCVNCSDGCVSCKYSKPRVLASERERLPLWALVSLVVVLVFLPTIYVTRLKEKRSPFWGTPFLSEEKYGDLTADDSSNKSYQRRLLHDTLFGNGTQWTIVGGAGDAGYMDESSLERLSGSAGIERGEEDEEEDGVLGGHPVDEQSQLSAGVSPDDDESEMIRSSVDDLAEYTSSASDSSTESSSESSSESSTSSATQSSSSGDSSSVSSDSSTDDEHSPSNKSIKSTSSSSSGESSSSDSSGDISLVKEPSTVNYPSVKLQSKIPVGKHPSNAERSSLSNSESSSTTDESSSTRDESSSTSDELSSTSDESLINDSSSIQLVSDQLISTVKLITNNNSKGVLDNNSHDPKKFSNKSRTKLPTQPVQESEQLLQIPDNKAIATKLPPTDPVSKIHHSHLSSVSHTRDEKSNKAHANHSLTKTTNRNSTNHLTKLTDLPSIDRQQSKLSANNPSGKVSKTNSIPNKSTYITINNK